MAQPIRTATNQPYGQAKAQADAQRAAPLPDASSWEAPVIPLHEPTARPGQHVMDGVDIGPGRNAAQAGVIGADDPTGRDQMLNTLRGYFDKYPLPGLRDAIQAWSQAPSWSFDDLLLNGPDSRMNGESGIEEDTTDPVSGFMFNPGARLDPSQVTDRRRMVQGSHALAEGAAEIATSIRVGPNKPIPPSVTDILPDNAPEAFAATPAPAAEPKLRTKGPR